MILAWAWRIPFLLSLPLTIAIGIMRRAIKCSPMQKSGALDSALHTLKRSLFKTVPITSFLPVSFLGLPGTLGAVNKYFCFNHINTFFSILWIHCSICWTSTMFKIGIVATLLLICPLWFLLQKPSFGAILTSQLLLALLFGHMSGIIMEMLGLQFRHFVRCRGMNLAYTFPIAIWGGTAPLVNTWMIQKTGLLLFPAFYIMLFGLLALPAEWRLRTVED